MSIPEDAAIDWKESSAQLASPRARKVAKKAVAYTMAEWLKRDIRKPELFLGHVFMAGSRTLLAAESGLGKTQITIKPHILLLQNINPRLAKIIILLDPNS
jgi:hypothetical protein